ncbi:pilus assembly protein TadG-related protein [Micromonospora arborensis]|uniref:pilus assembly protein TadG-related protein n=1 Tax=Micromonospora arborensis TaxID=2116518 RepID=UPI00340029B5
MRSPVRRFGGDDGRVSVFFAIITPAFLAMIGLVVDGGAQVRALQRADNIAAEAARAAGQAIQAGVAIAGGEKHIDHAAAAAAVQAYLGALDGVTGQLVVDDDQHLTVTVTVTYDPILLDLLGGGGGSTVRGTAHATLVAG